MNKYAWLCCMTASLSLIGDEGSSEVAISPQPAMRNNEAYSNSMEASQQPRTSIRVAAAKDQGQNNNSMQRRGTQNQGMQIDGNTSATPHVKGSVDFKLFGDFLYWDRSTGPTFLTDGVGLSVTVNATQTLADVTHRGKSFQPQYGYEPGFTAGFGFDFARDGWDLEASYTWMNLSGSRHFRAETEASRNSYEVPVAYWQDLETLMLVSSASDHAKMTLNLGEIELGRKFYTSKNLLLRPHMGLVCTYIPYTTRVNYTYTLSEESVGSGTERLRSSEFHNHGYGLGIGGSVGLDTEWRVGSGFAFVGNLSFASLYTHHTGKATNKVTNRDTNVVTTNLFGKMSLSRMQFLSFIFLGVDWHTYFNEDKYCFSAHLGWDFISGFETLSPVAYNDVLTDAFALQGLRAGIKFDF